MADLSTDDMYDNLRSLLDISDSPDNRCFVRDRDELSTKEYAEVISTGSICAISGFDMGYTDITKCAEFLVRKFGEKIRPWIKPFYRVASVMPDTDHLQLSTTEEVEAFDEFHFDDHLKPWLNFKDGDDDAPDFVEELKACAYNIVMENPGIERSEWIDELIRQYPSEVVDAYGINPREVYHDLSDLWEMEYTDPETHEWNSFAGWSEYLATDPDALQGQLERARERIRELEAEVALLKARTQNKAHRAEK